MPSPSFTHLWRGLLHGTVAAPHYWPTSCQAERDKVGGWVFPSCSILGALIHYGCCFVRDNQTDQSSSIIQRSSGKVMVDSTKFCYCSETTLRSCSPPTYQSMVLGEATIQCDHLGNVLGSWILISYAVRPPTKGICGSKHVIKCTYTKYRFFALRHCARNAFFFASISDSPLSPTYLAPQNRCATQNGCQRYVPTATTWSIHAVRHSFTHLFVHVINSLLARSVTSRSLARLFTSSSHLKKPSFTHFHPCSHSRIQ